MFSEGPRGWVLSEGPPSDEASPAGTDIRAENRLMSKRTDSNVFGTVTVVTTVPGSVPAKITFCPEVRWAAIIGTRSSIY